MATDNPADHATGFFQRVQIVAIYMDQRVRPLQAGLLANRLRDTVLRGQFLRALAWILSLNRLNDVRDFQALEAATRSLLEIAIDMLLVTHDRTEIAAERLHAWGESAKLKQAEAIVNYYRRRGVPVPRAQGEVEQFVRVHRERIHALRRSHWPQRSSTPDTSAQAPRHPDRWTGQDLLSDAREADALEGRNLVSLLGIGLEEFYETEFRRICWSVHGSALASVVGVPLEGFFLMYALACNWCADFGLFCSRLILRDFGYLDHLPALDDEWARVRAAGNQQYLAKIYELPPP